MMMEVPQGKFDLTRGATDDGSLRAWDAADEYILNHLAEIGGPTAGRTLVVNDGFGALGVALSDSAEQLVSWGDSVSAHRALALNLRVNANTSRPADHKVTTLPSTEDPQGVFDLVLIKVPKHNSLLEDQLHRLRNVLREGSIVVVGGMARHIHRSTLELFETILGPIKTSLAKKKARLGFVEFDKSLSAAQNPWPVSWVHDGLRVTNYAGVFSARRLDIGTRVLLENLPTTADVDNAVDLGCGNGIVGSTYLRRNPQAQCTFIDESYGAVASAEATADGAGLSSRARFVAADITEAQADILPPGSVDLVLNNPPFHSNAALSSHNAKEMFKASYRSLRPKGELVVVANRHLGYHVSLKRVFGNCETVASNSKFVVLRSIR